MLGVGPHDTRVPARFHGGQRPTRHRHAPGPRRMTSFQDRVLDVLAELRPALRADGGDIALVSADEASGRVEVHLTGACRTCAASSLTMSMGVEARLKQRIPTVRSVISV
jgi:Fe-S cluster biogenesis protein NfuA